VHNVKVHTVIVTHPTAEMFSKNVASGRTGALPLTSGNNGVFIVCEMSHVTNLMFSKCCENKVHIL
jgi:hypothetical protein